MKLVILVRMRFNTTTDYILREDLLLVFEMLNGFENIDINILFLSYANRSNKGHEVTVLKTQCC